MAPSMRRKAYAKITLYLHAEKKEETGLHFKNVIVPIDLFDMVYLEVNDTMHIETDKKYLPNDKRNTVYKTINIMKHTYKIKDNFKVRIIKNIPAQSGLGGGSADAAAVIHMLNESYNLNMTEQELLSMASRIDEDTPYCLFNKPSLVQGSGNVIEPIAFDMDLYYVMVKPPFGTSTKSFLKRFVSEEKDNDKMDTLINAMKQSDYKGIHENTHNDFQQTVVKKNSQLKKVIQRLETLGLKGVCMTGSGTCIYGLTDSKKEAIKIYEKIVFDYPFVKYGQIQK